MEKVKSVLLLGVGGISMYQLATAFVDLGYKVFGYDANLNSKFIDVCKQKGVEITNQFNRKFTDVDFCVSTAAVKENNKYIKVLKKLKIPIYDRALVLGEFAKRFEFVIAVCGTHGKSTTASLIYQILRESECAVSCHIGAEVENARFCLHDEYLVVEACEYNKSFLSLYPNLVVVTNVEAEHMDSYKTMFNLRLAFATFAKRANFKFAFLEKSTKFLAKIKDVEFVPFVEEGEYATQLKGKYNLKNISLAVAVCKKLGVKESVIRRAVENFSGVKRRYQFLGGKEQKIFIDYAHHPTEIESFIKAFNNEFKNNLIIFQPHTYSRTKLLLKDFVKVLKEANKLCIYKEYPAREKPSAGLSAYKLYLVLKKAGIKCEYVANFKRISKYLVGIDAVAFVGAGDIDKIATKFI